MKRHAIVTNAFFPWRFYLIISLLIIVVIALVARMVYLTVYDRKFLETQADSRILRTVLVPAYRGMILDRNNIPLAVSTPVDSIWINPQDFQPSAENLARLSNLLNISTNYIESLVADNSKRSFVYLKRDVDPDIADQVWQLAIPGIYLQRTYHRYYPQAAVDAHVVGFTNIDDQGQEGLELAYNNWLQGTPGKMRVIKDLYGNTVAVVNDISSARPGHDLVLSIDNRLQFLAYSILQETVTQYQAQSGSVVILNPKTGEILAMANMPAYNPNNRPTFDDGRYRNRAITDAFEPGSVMKPFSVMNDLMSGKYTPNTLIDTSPGWFRVGIDTIHDDSNNGIITVTQVLQKSSNIGAAKMALSLSPDSMVSMYRNMGFGQSTYSGFPGESAGFVPDYREWRSIDQATVSFGYGVMVTVLQLAHAYSTIANNGVSCPVTFLKLNQPPHCIQVLDPQLAKTMLHMLESVLQPGGTGTQAAVPGYLIAGKTGTANIANHGYQNHQVTSSFVGIAPVSDPQLVIAVVIQKPKSAHFGAYVAAPAFSKIMAGALRLLDIPPDQPQQLTAATHLEVSQ